MNNISLIGRLTRDPETITTTTGKLITQFTIAFDVGYGERKKAIFLDCKLWGERGEKFAKFVRKGHRVGITGSLDQDEWDDKTTGEKKKKLLINVNDFTLIERKGDGSPVDPTPERTERPPARPNRPAKTPSQDLEDDDDIPF